MVVLLDLRPFPFVCVRVIVVVIMVHTVQASLLIAVIAVVSCRSGTCSCRSSTSITGGSSRNGNSMKNNSSRNTGNI